MSRKSCSDHDVGLRRKGKVLIVIFEGFEYFETMVPMLRLREEGYEVEIASKAVGVLKGGHGLELKSSLRFDRAVPEQYQGLIIPGGAEAGYPGKDIGHSDVARIVTEFQKTGRPIAAICMGVGILAKTGVLKGRKAACDTSTIPILKECGAEYVNEPLVRTGPFITSRYWPDLTEFCRALIHTLRRERPVLMITGPGFEDIHVRGTFYRLREEGYRIALVCPDQNLWKGKAKLDERGVLIGKGGVETWGAPAPLEKMDSATYSGLFLPGGKSAVDVLGTHQGALDAVRMFINAGLPIAAAAEGVDMLMAAGVKVKLADKNRRYVKDGQVMTAFGTDHLPELWAGLEAALNGARDSVENR